MRSKWKVKSIIKSISESVVSNVQKRNLYIYPNYVGLSLNIMNGKSITSLEISSGMVGFLVGDFVLTKKLGNVHTLKKRSNSYRRKRLN